MEDSSDCFVNAGDSSIIGPMLDTLLAYLHLFAILGLAGALIIENMAIKAVISGEDAQNLAKVNTVYGLTALVTLLCGMTLWLWLGKPAAFYSSNPLFQLKLGLFVVIVLLSIYPTMFFTKHRKSDATSISVPKIVTVSLKLELGLLIILPILASLMAKGVGLSN